MSCCDSHLERCEATTSRHIHAVVLGDMIHICLPLVGFMVTLTTENSSAVTATLKIKNVMKSFSYHTFSFWPNHVGVKSKQPVCVDLKNHPNSSLQQPRQPHQQQHLNVLLIQFDLLLHGLQHLHLEPLKLQRKTTKAGFHQLPLSLPNDLIWTDFLFVHPLKCCNWLLTGWSWMGGHTDHSLHLHSQAPLCL